MVGRDRLLALLLMIVAAASGRGDDPFAELGRWDGKTEKASLDGPYEDPLQQQVPFGRRSFYLAPWRAYLDTRPASCYLDALGINFNVGAAEAPAVATVLAEAGVRSARVEIGWGSVRYDQPDAVGPEHARQATVVLQSLKKAGIRPLMLLNAHHGVPCPLRMVEVRVEADAAAGARQVRLSTVEGIKPHYSGINTPRDYKNPARFITRFDRATRVCELSGPLPVALKAGQKVGLATLRYQPFSGAVFADGTANPAAQETLDGWMKYVAAISTLAKTALGSEGASDAGFDLEVWNEYTFGSDFLSDRHYYDPPRQYREPIRYTRHGLTREGPEIILSMTVDHVNDPKNRLPGVKVLSGFANQRPWENGTEMWPGQAGFSRHYYTGVRAQPLTPKTVSHANSGPVNARGGVDGVSDGKEWHTVKPGTYFVPTVRLSLPEWYHCAYQTEFMTRDLQPFPGPWARHHRFSHPGTGQPAEVWMTEFNFDRWPWAERLMQETGCARTDARLVRLMQHTAARTTLRSMVFHSHKGVRTIDLYGARGDDLSLSVLPQSFFDRLKEDGFALTPQVREAAGLQLQALGRVTRLMSTGKKLPVTRHLSVRQLVEYRPRLVFRGDGTREHPDRYHRDDFVCLPFQLDAGRFAVGYYVMTRDVTHAWDASRDRFDPARYVMPAQEFDLTLGNVRGSGARVSVWDPLTDRKYPVSLGRGERDALTVKLATSDTPRFLLIEEDQPGPLIEEPRLEAGPGEKARLRFRTNLPASPEVSWGRLPERTDGGQQKLPVGKTHECVLPDLPANSGLRVTVERDGLRIAWPHWGHDVQGVLRWETAKSK